MRYQVIHTTDYFYSQSVPLCQNEVHLRPRDTPRQSCLRHRLDVHPLPHGLDECSDYFGNHIQFFMIQDRHDELSVTAQSEVEIEARTEIDPDTTPPWEEVRDFLMRDRTVEALDVRQFCFDSPRSAASDALAELAAPSFPPCRPWMRALVDLTTRIHREFVYDPTATTVTTPLESVLELRRGVCQDFAHLQIACLRSLGLPARYVSGYLQTTPPPGQPRLIGADASHAWLSAYCPVIGWVEFDPTNDSIPSEDHITVAWGRDYGDVCPISGVFIGGGQHSMRVSVDVRPLDDMPSPS